MTVWQVGWLVDRMPHSMSSSATLHPQVRQIAADLFPGVLTPSAHTLACCAGAEGGLQHEASVPTALVREVSLGIAGVGMPKPRPKPGRPCFPEGSP